MAAGRVAAPPEVSERGRERERLPGRRAGSPPRGCPGKAPAPPPLSSLEGLLTLRAKPPSEAEYTDVLQKIKYAFSLLVSAGSRGSRPGIGDRGEPGCPTHPSTAHPPTHRSQARLRRNIANPSSPELLHFLFGPLQMVRPPRLGGCTPEGSDPI